MKDYGGEGYIDRWENILDELKEDEEKLQRTKKHYEDMEMEILQKTDFNKIYGKNNDKVRKYHVRKKLANTVEQKEQLERKIEAGKREILLLKAKVAFEIELMRLQ